MDPDAAGENLLSLREILGMTDEDADRLIKEFEQMFIVCDNPVDLCKIVVDKYGVDAVFSTICLWMTLKRFSLKEGGLDDRMRSQCPSRN